MKPVGSSPSPNPLPDPDSCGSNRTGGVPDGGFGVDWSDACRAHDECYAEPGASKVAEALLGWLVHDRHGATL